MNRVNCDACGHQNPAGRLICESCGAPLTASSADPGNMKTQAIPSLDDLLTQDRQAFKGHLANRNQDAEADQGPTQAIDFNKLSSQYPEFASPGQRQAPASISPFGSDFEDEDEAAPTEAIDFSKLAELHPELAARAAEDPNARQPAPPAPLPRPQALPQPQPPQPQIQTPRPQPQPQPQATAPKPPARDLGVGAAPPEATAAVKTPAPPPARKKSNTLLIVGIVVAVVLFCLCPGAIGGLWYGGVLTALGARAPVVEEKTDKVEKTDDKTEKTEEKADDDKKDKADEEEKEDSEE